MSRAGGAVAAKSDCVGGEWLTRVAARAAQLVLLSGDCPAALGAVAGLQRRHRDLTVVWLDTDGDFNTPAITITAALDGLGGTPVYLHLDVDVIDSAQLPGLRLSAGPGPSVAQIEECLAAVRATSDERGASM